ncbi:MAG TPA: hypothetical protein VE782_17755, partial [Myxococcaceae bacterium]|nr:hypothetical protein [Myxococcaceae bacterium]
AIYELVSSHPYLCKRVAELKNLEAPGSVRVAARNPLSYPFAPLFGGLAISGGGAAGALMIVAIVGMLAAIAVPNFLKYQQMAAQRRMQQTQMQMQAEDEGAAIERLQAEEEDAAAEQTATEQQQ